ncbi:MAG: carbon-nitrogen hydrolase family protein [Planctomycetales bacterium]|nr:carbon-nitrogen hydrolase family protein [Planctomycetales bacterium]
MKPKPFKLALIQMLVRGGEQSLNVSHALELIAAASSHGADVALLPECLDLGWAHPASQTMAGEIPSGTVCQALMNSAARHDIHLCAGLTEKYGHQVFNAAVLIDNHGKLLCQHRKIHELEIAHPYYAQGDRLNIAETHFGTFGLMICADAFAQDRVLTRSLGYLGADVILSPCAWAVPADHDQNHQPYGQLWRDSYIPVAKEFSIPIVGVSNVGKITSGPWQGRNCIGCSLAIDAQGNELVQGPYGVDQECILYIDINPVARPARGTAWTDIWKADA